MAGILAPSNVGYKSVRPTIPHRWRLGTSGWINSSNSPTLVASYKSPLDKSDFKMPTDYTRMVARITSRGSVNAFNLNANGSKKYQVECSMCSWFSIRDNPYGCSIANGVVDAPQALVDEVVRECIIEANQLSNNILEDLGQLKQTGELIAQLFNLICELYLAAVKGQWRRLRRMLAAVGHKPAQSLANGWLLYFYGIKPLIGTIEALATREGPVYRVLKVRKRASTAVDPRTYTTSTSTYHSFSGKAQIQTQAQLEAKIRMDQSTATWADLGVTGTDIDVLVTAWALVPYSFVLDWILPVEAWLRSLSWSPTLVFHSMFVGRRHEAKCEATNFAPLSSAGPYPYSGQLPRARIEVKFYSRKIFLDAPPLTGLNLWVDLNRNQIFSASALLVQR